MIHTFVFMVCGLIVAGNGFICVLILFTKRLRTCTNGFLVSLALSDLLTGGVVIPLNETIPASPWAGFMTAFILLSGVLNLLGVSFDRLVAVTKPFQYKIIVRKYFVPLILANWIIPTAVSLVPLWWQDEDERMIHNVYVLVLVVGFVVIPFFILIAAYYVMFKNLKENSRRLSVSNASFSTRQRRRRVSSERKVVKLLFIIAVFFVLSWLPVIFLTIASSVGRTDLVVKSAKTLSVFTIAIGSLANPLLYVFRKQDMKKELEKIIRCLCRFSKS